jgi:drug/metabolite transporter (DMT)-like permease
MKVSPRIIAIIALIIANVVWGAANPIFKWALEDVPPFTLAFFRFFLASLILWPFVLPHIALRLSDIPKIILLSFVGIVVNISLFFLGLNLTTSIDAPIIGAAAPILLLIIAFFYLRERPSKRMLLGTIISLVGILFIILRPILESGYEGGSILGNLLIFLATAAFVVYTILLKKFDLPYNSLALIFWIFFVGSLMFFPLFLYETQSTNLLHNINVKTVVGILFGALSSSALAYLCYDLGVRYLKANEVGIFFYLDPIATVAFAVPLLGEQVTFGYIVGSLIVFAGIFIAEGKLHRHHPHHLLSRRQD